MEDTKRSQKASLNPPYLRRFEIVLALVGGLNCVVVPVFFAVQQRSLLPPRADFWPDFWPRPGFYSLEILVIGLATTYFVLTNRASRPSRWNGLPWISAGILLTLVIMGIFGFGLFLLPAMLSFLAAGILGDRRQGGNWPTHTMLFFFSAMVQAVAAVLFTLLFG